MLSELLSPRSDAGRSAGGQGVDAEGSSRGWKGGSGGSQSRVVSGSSRGGVGGSDLAVGGDGGGRGGGHGTRILGERGVPAVGARGPEGGREVGLNHTSGAGKGQQWHELLCDKTLMCVAIDDMGGAVGG